MNRVLTIVLVEILGHLYVATRYPSTRNPQQLDSPRSHF